jgi:hypothetical protein
LERFTRSTNKIKHLVASRDFTTPSLATPIPRQHACHARR